MSDPTTPVRPPLLSARGLRKSYQLGPRAIEVLRGIDLEVQAGEFIVMRGASGAGKSTLLHLLGGLDTPSAGEVHALGRNLSRLPGDELARFRSAHVGFIFQAYHLLPELDALENVALPARLARSPIAKAEERAKGLLQRVGLGHRLDHRPSELSGGEQQRVAIARSLINQPTLLLADEPTGNLDSHTGGEILELLAEIHRETSITLLIATHDDRLATLAPRSLRLADGEMQSTTG
jgi:ABC-type lipoprotein export system ATPase subunit